MPFKPPEPEKGDPNTIGGYAAVHGRPAAFEGADGYSYSVELSTDSTGERDAGKHFGAYFMFLKWNETAEPVIAGHLESAFLEYGASADEARGKLGAMSLSQVLTILNDLIRTKRQQAQSRPWWEAMRNEGEQS